MTSLKYELWCMMVKEVRRSQDRVTCQSWDCTHKNPKQVMETCSQKLQTQFRADLCRLHGLQAGV